MLRLRLLAFFLLPIGGLFVHLFSEHTLPASSPDERDEAEEPCLPVLERRGLMESCEKVLDIANQRFPHDQYNYKERALTCIQLVRSIQSWTDPHVSLLERSNSTGNHSEVGDDDYFEQEDDAIWDTPEHYTPPGQRWLRQHNVTDVDKCRSQPPSDYNPQVSLYRLASKMQAASQRNSSELKVLVLGGSMTAGVELEHLDADAWPAQLRSDLTTKPTHSNTTTMPYTFQITSIASGGRTEVSWLADFNNVEKHDADIILLDLAINDQCDYDVVPMHSKAVGDLSNVLLNKLVNLPSSPAVLTVEMFRTADRVMSDATKHCKDHIMKLSGKTYFYCPEWWLPQDWRQEALQANKVPFISYRDAVWPTWEHPPKKLDVYWSGLSHPQVDTHHLVATTVMFAFQVVHDNLPFFLTSEAEEEEIPPLEAEMMDGEETDFCSSNVLDTHHPELKASYAELMDEQVEAINQQAAFMEQQVEAINQQAAPLMGKAWKFGTDSQPVDRLDRYGWIYENNNNDNNPTYTDTDLVFRLNLKVRPGGKIVINRLVSYDDRMATVNVWFTLGENVLTDPPIWNVTSWHPETTSVPEPHVIHLPEEFTFTDGFRLSWPQDEEEKGGFLWMTMNVAVLPGSSKSAINKFKLISIASC